MFTATKFEEIDPPDINELTSELSHGFSKDEIFEMEVQILNALGFSLCKPTPVQFIDRFQHGGDEEHRYLMHYILELALLDYRMVKHQPSVQAASAALVSSAVLQRRLVWRGTAACLAKEMELAILRCRADFHTLLLASASSVGMEVKQKFSGME